MSNYNYYRDREDNPQKSMLPVAKFEARTPVSNRNEFPRASIPANSTTARSNRMAEPSRNSVASGFGSRASMAPRASMAMRNSLATGSMSGRMSLLPAGYKRLPQMLLTKPPLMKDTRSFQDKGYVASMCYRVQDFLQRCEENKEAPQFQYTEKTLRTPTKSDFRNIFEYLFQQLDEGYQLSPKNVEEEVPKLLQALGYPYPLKKSTMSTIGAPHSWPPLLAALDWLITVIEESDQNDESLLEDFQLAYSYFTTCYKKAMDTPQEDEYDFKEELETYRSLLQKEDMDEELVNLKARRLNNEKTIQQIKEDMERENEECRKLMTDNTDLENDISKLKDYCLESSVTISRVEENIEEEDKTIQKLMEKLSQMESENIKKEQFIRSQKMSGEEARTLLVKRNTLKEQLSAAREQQHEAEKKFYELQPRFFKESAKVRSQYRTFLSCLQEFCDSLVSLNNAQNINWSQYEYDAVSNDFTKSSRNQLTELIDKLKKEVAQTIEKYRIDQNRVNRLIEDKTKGIGEMKARKQKKELENNLEVERITRKLEDIARDLQGAELELGLVHSKHKTAKEELNEQNDRNLQLKNKFAEAQKRYLQQKNSLEKVFNDVMAATFDKVAKLYTKFNEIMKYKQELKELGEHILEENRKELHQIRLIKANEKNQ